MASEESVANKKKRKVSDDEEEKTATLKEEWILYEEEDWERPEVLAIYDDFALGVEVARKYFQKYQATRPLSRNKEPKETVDEESQMASFRSGSWSINLAKRRVNPRNKKEMYEGLEFF